VHIGRKEEIKNVYKILFVKLEEKGPFGRPRRRWENNIKVYFRQIGRHVLY